jgi:hypothetical protein
VYALGGSSSSSSVKQSSMLGVSVAFRTEDDPDGCPREGVGDM